jgi:lysine/ornithine N-monooxygenase
VIVAVGISHFQYVPEIFSELPVPLVAHSSEFHDLKPLQGKQVTVVGSGASGIDVSALLHEIGADVTLLSRKPQVYFHDSPADKPRSFLNRLRHPASGIGPGWRSRFYTDAPLLFHKLPLSLRRRIVETHLKPAAGWPMKERVVGKIPMMLGTSVIGAAAQDGGVLLNLVRQDGTRTEHWTERVILATGYRVDLRRLAFLDGELLATIRAVGHCPVLSSDFQSSARGLYFVGVAAAESFGPMLRFAFGADFAARHIARNFSGSRTCAADPYPELVVAARR